VNAHAPIQVLVADDDPAVREAYRTIFARREDGELTAASEDLFGDDAAVSAEQCCVSVISIVDQGEAAIALAGERLREGRPFAVAFVDMRMPPGIDGATTIERLWRLDPDLQVVLATAYSDTPWQQLRRRLGCSDRLVILRKPFEPVEAQQLVEAMGRKRAQLEEVRDRERILERLVEEKTKELRSALLVAAEAARVKGEFLANMSHEIRTPLTAILGFAELLGAATMTDTERMDLAAVVDRNCTHLLQLVDAVLDLSKIEAGKLHVENVACDLCELVGSVVELMQPRALAKGLLLKVRWSDECPRTCCLDPLRVRQILLNLVGNAVKFTARGHINLVVGVDATRPDAPRVSIAVEDTGIGIAEEQRAGLFQPFAQADASTTRMFGGTGLGLALSQHLAELLGGELTLGSTLGVGSTFTLRLPLRAAPEQSGDKSSHEPQTAIGLSARILLVEDGQDNRRLLTTVLTRAGAMVTTAENGKVAVDLVHDEGVKVEHVSPAFDLIVMDMQMPVMDGYGATRVLRERGYRGPILALTAHALAGERERCLAAGCDAYATKPIRAKDFVAVCSGLLSKTLG
jgi:two-component system, sensor histidine kinase and response regulator